ncbi:hypothetical protein QAD02_006866 [Eretmocerus hayati]|uniref:Uncharacterized protein n=1 Tax=Eretmocerus hayati TaxID=131215 RepID=A0ACC2N2C2_9HYME|nr:hypothetical protein QAD02_006866 [Eretmocerus hayati]
MTDISNQDLQDLLHYFSKNTYQASCADSKAQAIMQRCILLADIDYTHRIINNNGGDLSAHYPSHLIILENEKHHNQNFCHTPPPLRATETIYESLDGFSDLKDLMKNAKMARTRSRFPLPVILYNGRHVCRSATISNSKEIALRSGIEYFFPTDDSGTTFVQEINDDPNPASSDWSVDFAKVRSQDIKLLRNLNVGTIVDLMVEKKKIKYGVVVTSSEKVDKERRYDDFTLISLPYPGCEFFKEFRENNYFAKGLMYDWKQSFVDADIGVPENSITSALRIEWMQYRNWDLVKLTQNYLKLILRYLQETSSGLLIHCISGWDRTPLFISLLRISLWADGAIHTSLSPQQLLYYTIAYDWMLFGHNLQDRLTKSEEIFYFCFYFLKHIVDDEFSINRRISSRRLARSDDSDSQLDFMLENELGVTPSSRASNLSLNSISSQDNNPPVVVSSSSVESQDEVHCNGNVYPWTIYHHPVSKDASSGCCGSSNGSSNGHGSRSPQPVFQTMNGSCSTAPVAVPAAGRPRQRNESSSSAGSWQMVSMTGSLQRGANGHNLADGLPPESSHTPGNNSSSGDEYISRANKLNQLRQLFINIYGQAVGLKMKDNSEGSGIGMLFGNFVERVSILSGQRASS